MKNSFRTYQELIEENSFLEKSIKELGHSVPDLKRVEEELRIQ